MSDFPLEINNHDVKWLKVDSYWSVLYTSYSVLSFGILPLYCYYNPNTSFHMRCVECHPDLCEFVKFDLNGRVTVVPVEHFIHVPRSTSRLEHLIITEIENVRYVASSQDKYIFARLPFIPLKFDRFLHQDYLSVNQKDDIEDEFRIMKAQYGPNVMTIPDSSFMEIFFKHFMSPFFLFQYFSATVWIIEEYYLYSFLIIGLTIATIIFTTNEELFNLQRLKTLAGMEGTVRIFEQGSRSTVPIDQQVDVNLSSIVPDSVLVPGERFVVVEGMTMPCDAVVVSGRIIVDESMLTGESIPVSKGPINEHQLKQHRAVTVGCVRNVNGSNEVEEDQETELMIIQSGCVLFGGTKVRACYGKECIAVCCRTGFRSAKGQLVASLLTEKSGLIHFVSDALWIILYIVIFTTVIYLSLALRLYFVKDAPISLIILRYLDAITVAVPPLLTASLTIATAVSVERLKTSEIFVTETSRVNYAGMVNAVCFDKTGTLTQSSLNFVGASIVDKSGPEIRLKNFANKANALPLICLEIMATCHSLSLSGHKGDEPAGDPLEVELLQATGWTLRQAADGSGRLNAYARTEPEASHIVDLTKRYEVIKHFEFTPERLRACTLLKRPDSTIVYLMKGSPEMVMGLCAPDSLPKGLSELLLEITRRGLRVIAIAARECNEPVGSLQQLSQDQIEQLPNLNFVGLLFLSNALKEDTIMTIDQLYAGKVHANMITGDHVFTAIAVATECGLINRSKTFDRVDDQVYIVDEEESSGDTIILDSKTNRPVPGLSLAQLLLNTANTYHHEMSATNQPSNVENPVHLTEDEHPTSYQIAVTGKGLVSVQRNYPAAIVRVLVRYTRIFARTKPHDKKYIVELLLNTPEYESLDCLSSGGMPQNGFNSSDNVSSSMSNEKDENFEVMFCGDGANDMTALRASSVGLSLCDAETSVAAPVTSRSQTPKSVLAVIKEGRCSLITAYVLIVFNILYGAEQLFMACVYYYYGMTVGNYTDFVQDVFFALILSLAITLSNPHTSISIIHPPRRFLTTYFLTKLLAMLASFILFQIIGQIVLQYQDFYTEFESTTDDVLTTYYAQEVTVAQDIALVQLMTSSIVCTIGKPFREPWYYNKIHVGALVVQTGLVLWQMFDTDNSFLINYLSVDPLPTYFAFVLLLIMFMQFVVCFAISHFTDKFFFEQLRTTRFENMRKLTLQSDILRTKIARESSTGSLNDVSGALPISTNRGGSQSKSSGVSPNKRISRKKKGTVEGDEEENAKETDSLLTII